MRNKKAEQKILLGIVMAIFIIAIVALALIPEIFNQQAVMTSKQPISDESEDVSDAVISRGEVNESVNFTVTNYPSGWKITDCPLESFTVSNSTTAFTEDTDYEINLSTGVWNLLNTSATINLTIDANTTYSNYTFCADGYNTSSGARSMAGLIGLFAALALAIAIAAIGLKEWLNRR